MAKNVTTCPGNFYLTLWNDHYALELGRTFMYELIILGQWKVRKIIVISGLGPLCHRHSSLSYISQTLSLSSLTKLSLSLVLHTRHKHTHTKNLWIEETNHIFMIVKSIRTQWYHFQVRFHTISRPKLKVYIWHYSSTFYTLRFRRIGDHRSVYWVL